MNRYAVFIDAGYLKRVLRDFFGEPRISYRTLSELVARGDERLRTYYYDCAPWVSAQPTDEEKLRQERFERFIHALEQESRFQIRLGRLARYPTATGVEFVQKKTDVLFAVDLVKLSTQHQIQRAVLIAGDSDFVPAVEIARDSGTVTHLFYHDGQRPHEELLRACDDRTLIDREFIDRIVF